MKKKILLISLGLVAVGVVVFMVALIASGFNISGMFSSKRETNTYVVEEAFDTIQIDTKEADIIFKQSNDEKCSVVCVEREKEKHNVKVENGVLLINSDDTRSWYDYFSLFSGSLSVTVYLPSNAYSNLKIDGSTGDIEIPKEFSFNSVYITASTGDVKLFSSVNGGLVVETSTGNISLDKISAKNILLTVSTGKIGLNSVSCEDSITLKVSTGDITMNDVTCNNLFSMGSTGEIEMKNVVVSDTINFNRSTGDIYFDGCDAGTIYIKTSTGDVEGTLLSEKVFIVDTSTGNKDVPKTITGGRCEITTSTGDIKIGIKNN